MRPARFAAAVRLAWFRAVAGGFALTLALALVLATAPLVFADTAPPPAAAQDSNTVILAVLALGALAAILVLNRPRKPGGR